LPRTNPRTRSFCEPAPVRATASALHWASALNSRLTFTRFSLDNSECRASGVI